MSNQYLFVFAMFAWACGSGSSSTTSNGGTAAITSTGGVTNSETSANCPQGWLGCPCTADRSCSSDLICLASADGSNTMCVRAENGGSTSATGSGGTGGATQLVGGDSGVGGAASSSTGGSAGAGGTLQSTGGLGSTTNAGSGNLGGNAAGGVTSTSTECPVVSESLQIPTDITLRCIIALPALPPGSWWFVLAATDANGQPVVIPSSQTDGWVYANHTATLVGPTCDKVKQGTYSNLRFVYTCEGGEINTL